LGPGIGGIIARNTTSTVSIVSISDSTITGLSESVTASSNIAGSSTRAYVTRCTIEGNSYGPLAVALSIGGVSVSVGNSMIVNNSYAYYQSGATSQIYSSGNNQILGNATALGSLTLAALQ
jgi:hypothetical protein